MRVADFGIARAAAAAGVEKLTETGLSLGTPAYMSPEQAAGDDQLDGRSDLYALGCVLYEMLAGQPPFTGRTAQAVLARHAIDPVPSLRTVRSTVPLALDHAISTALAKVPADRFATAGAFAEALSANGATAPSTLVTPATRRSTLRRAKVPVAAAVLLGVGAGVIGVLQSRRGGPTVVPSASTMAVLPFSPTTSDSALVRLGRDLASTVSASLDGVGEIRTVDRLTVMAQAPEGGATLTLSEAAALARRLGATSVVHGSLARDGARVRLDVGLFTTDSLVMLARQSVLAAPESLSALTDSLVWKLLGDIWRHGRPPTPTLGAITTRSVDALRAYLDGERESVRGNLEEARADYGRAIAADSSFWFAYFRQGNVAGWAEGDVDSATEHAYWTHRHLLPQRERLLIEAARLDSGLFRQRARLEDIVQRYPDYWPAWWMLGDALSHVYGHIGSNAADTRRALERVVELNPKMVLAWAHLAWLASAVGDTTTEARALDMLERLRSGPTFLKNLGRDQLLGWRTTLALQRRSPAARLMLDSLYQDMVKPDRDLFESGVMIQAAGYPADQIEMNRRLLRHGVPPEGARILTYLNAIAWASRGAWDSALATREQLVRSLTDTVGLLDVYRTAVLATTVGALPADIAARRRPAAARLLLLNGPAYRAELAWLDGVLAAVTLDTAGLVATRVRLRATGAKWSASLDRSLGAFESALRGHRRSAATAMAALEWELADGSPWFARDPETPHKLLRGIDRMAAAKWLLAEGDSAQAVRLLSWCETFPPLDDKVPLAPPAYLLRASIEDGHGDVAAARRDYEKFLMLYDMPPPAHRHLVTEARAAVARLGAIPVPAPER